MKTIALFLTLTTLAFGQYPSDPYSAQRAQIARDNARYAQEAADRRAQVARENARYAQEAADRRAQVARENARYAQQAAEMRAQVARENTRYAQLSADQRTQVARENARTGSAYGGYGSYPPSHGGSYGGYSSSPRVIEVPLVEEYYVEDYRGEGYIVTSRPAPNLIQVQGGSRGRGRYFSLEPDVSAVDGRARPRGAQGYYFIDGRVVYDTELAPPSVPAEVVRVPKANVPTAPSVPVAPAVVEKPKPTLPTACFNSLYAKFVNEPSAAHHAYLELIDEPIAPQAADAPVPVVPEINPDLAAEVKRDRFSAIKAIFDNGAFPDIKSLSQNSVWTGRCVFRSSPKWETGAMLGFLAENNNVYTALLTAATATDLLAGDVGKPKKFDGLGAESINLIKIALLGSDRDVSRLTNRAREDRPLSRDSLFFDGAITPGGFSVGHRLRLYEGPTKKMIAVVESYSPHKGGVAFNDKRLDYLEPVQYCYFTRAVAW